MISGRFGALVTLAPAVTENQIWIRHGVAVRFDKSNEFILSFANINQSCWEDRGVTRYST